jgi:transposase
VEKRLEGDDLKCSNCGEKMEEIGETVVRRLKLVPAKAVIVETHIYAYACKKCTVGENEKSRLSAQRMIRQ